MSAYFTVTYEVSNLGGLFKVHDESINTTLPYRLFAISGRSALQISYIDLTDTSNPNFAADNTVYQETTSLRIKLVESEVHDWNLHATLKSVLEENPDSFLNGNRTLFIDYVAREDTGRGHRQYYHVKFEFDPSTDTVCNVYVSGEMIPDEVPSDAVLEDIEATIDIHGETTDEKIEIIEGIYPNCTAA